MTNSNYVIKVQIYFGEDFRRVTVCVCVCVFTGDGDSTSLREGEEHWCVQL